MDEAFPFTFFRFYPECWTSAALTAEPGISTIEHEYFPSWSFALDDSDWLSLGDAAAILGVHPSTVRHWADEGDLPSHRTPGGHRRFRRADLEQWATNQRPRPDTVTASEVQLVIQNALGRARMEVSGGQLSNSPWYNELDDEGKRAQAALGRRLLETLSRYLVEDASDPDVIDEIRLLGVEYAQLSQQQGLSLTQTVRAFLFFRDLLVDSVIQLAEMLGLHTAMDWGARLRQVNKLTDQLLLAIVESSEQDST